ncbi:MAG: hypothetical protein ACI9OJ_001273 [Myxococcota bacterium]|jgi:hypothetical protein
MSTMIIVLGIGLHSGCKSTSTPTDAFDRLAKAGEAGDLATFLGGLTQDSADAFDGLLAVSGTEHAKKLRLGGLGTAVRAISAQTPGQQDLALVLVETTDSPPQRAQVLMRLEDGDWKLDLISTELLWNRNWELSGGSPKRGAWYEINPSTIMQ